MPISQRRMASLRILILIWILPGLAFAQPRGRLVGKVVDPAGKPIPGVVVTVTSPQIPTFKQVKTTDKNGSFIVDFRDVNVTYQYRFDKVGYQSLSVNQEWQLEGTQRLQWTMTPGTAVAAGVPPASTSQQAISAFNEGVIALRAKDYAAAEAKFSEAVRHDPQLVQGWVALSTVQVQTGRNQEAAEAAEKAIALGSTDEAVLTARWQAYRKLKDEKKAAEALAELERIGRRAEEAKRIHNEAVVLVKAGNDAGAFAKFQEALDVDPTLQPSLLGLAAAGAKIGRHREAATAAETVLKADPTNQQAIRLRYNAYLNLENQEGLFDALVGLAAVEPVVAVNGLLKLAFEAYDANDKALAKKRFIRVLEVDPNQALVHYHLALVYTGEGATAEARNHLERFLSLAPNNPEAETARELLNRLSKARDEEARPSTPRDG